MLLGGLMVLVLVGLATKSTSLQLHTQVGWRWSRPTAWETQRPDVGMDRVRTWYSL